MSELNDAYVAAIQALIVTVQAQKDGHKANVDAADQGIELANGEISAIQAQAAQDARPAQDRITGFQATAAVESQAVIEGQEILDGLAALIAQVAVPVVSTSTMSSMG
jgi:hypothetical protein